MITDNTCFPPIFKQCNLLDFTQHTLKIKLKKKKKTTLNSRTRIFLLLNYVNVNTMVVLKKEQRKCVFM